MIDLLIGIGIAYLIWGIIVGVLIIVVMVFSFRRLIRMSRENDEFSRDIRERIHRR